MGAILAFISLMFFIFLIWEALARQRPVLSVGHMSGSLEWDTVLPRKVHHIREMPKVYGARGRPTKL